MTSFAFYWWHRATHASDLLWRLFHQLHHSPRRVEALTAFYAHPLDSAAAVLISAFSSYLVLGASPIAAAWALFFTSGFDLFLHGDMKTPRWLGYFLQRPEMHTVHHAHGHHAQNYGLPLWDLLFGTWSNPEERVARLGFDADKADNIHAMLLCRDVHKGG
nr:sterol desaturase family protein [Chromobacterium violaceum]